MARQGWPPQAVPIAAFALVAAGLVVAAPLLSRSLRAEARRRAGTELAAVAQLKADLVVAWRSDQLRSARFAASYPSVQTAVASARAGTVPPPLAAHVSDVLAHLAELHLYPRVALLSPAGAELAGWSRAGGPHVPPSPELLRRAAASADGAASHLALDARDRPQLDVAIAMGATGEGAPYLLFLRADASSTFEDVLERWPVPSETAAG